MGIIRISITFEVFVDGGFRAGTDVFKALGMGADFVFIGRPIVYGLAVGVIFEIDL